AQLRRTVGIHATVVGFALHTHHVAVAHGAALRHMKLLVSARMILVFDHLHDFGNHITATFDHYPVADLYAQTLDLVLAVQRGSAHRGAADRHRLELGHRSQLAGTSHLHAGVLHLRPSAARGRLVRDSPARRV